MRHKTTVRHARWFAMLSLALTLCGAGADEARTPGEYQVKSVYLFNFTKFMDWPESAFATTNAPFIIGILGDNLFGNTLEETVHGESVRGHPIQIRQLRDEPDITNCHALFLSRSEQDNLPAILAQVSRRPILTVGETEGAAARGTMVNLLLVKGSVKMEINPTAVSQGGLRVSSKLMGLAKIVDTNPKPNKP